MMIPMNVNLATVRPATPADAVDVIDLISFADENALLYLTGQSDLQHAKQIYRQDFARDDVYFSYLFTQVCFVDGNLAGCILAFPGFLESTFMTQSTRPLDDVREAEDDELYIDSLAIYPAFRGQKLSRHLIEAAKVLAKKYQLNKLSLLVDDAKPHLERMYAGYGFETVETLTLDGVKHKKMTRVINPMLSGLRIEQP